MQDFHCPFLVSKEIIIRDPQILHNSVISFFKINGIFNIFYNIFRCTFSDTSAKMSHKRTVVAVMRTSSRGMYLRPNRHMFCHLLIIMNQTSVRDHIDIFRWNRLSCAVKFSLFQPGVSSRIRFLFLLYHFYKWKNRLITFTQHHIVAIVHCFFHIHGCM